MDGVDEFLAAEFFCQWSIFSTSYNPLPKPNRLDHCQYLVTAFPQYGHELGDFIAGSYRKAYEHEEQEYFTFELPGISEKVP